MTFNLKLDILNKLSLFFFYVFVALLPFNLRLIAYKGITDFVSLFLYLGDFLLILALLLWGVKKFQGKTLFEQVDLKYRPLVVLLFLLFFWQILSMAGNGFTFYSLQSIYQFLLGIILFCYILANLSQKKVIRRVLVLILILALFEGILGIYQFADQSSLGIPQLGESIISPNLKGVAKITLESGEKIIRAYGTFPHPNVFAGFLLISFYILIIWWCFEADFWKKEAKNRTFPQVLLAVFWLILAISLLFTFSRTVLIVIFLIFLTILIKCVITCGKLKDFFSSFPQVCLIKCQITKHCMVFKIIFASVLIISVLGASELLFARFLPSKISKEDLFVKDRILYTQIALKMIEESPFLGVGSGNFALMLPRFSKEKLEPWQFQPSHNNYLLIAAENGLPALFLFLLFIFIYLRILLCPAPESCRNAGRVVPGFLKKHQSFIPHLIFDFSFKKIMGDRGTYQRLGAGFFLSVFAVGIFVIMLFDHYFWTIHSAHLLFWLILALFLKLKEILKKESF